MQNNALMHREVLKGHGVIGICIENHHHALL